MESIEVQIHDAMTHFREELGTPGVVRISGAINTAMVEQLRGRFQGAVNRLYTTPPAENKGVEFEVDENLEPDEFVIQDSEDPLVSLSYRTK